MEEEEEEEEEEEAVFIRDSVTNKDPPNAHQEKGDLKTTPFHYQRALEVW